MRLLFEMALWRGITNGWEDFVKNTRMLVGDGSIVKLWEHVWCGDVSLREAFPNIYRLACDKDALVGDYLHVHDGVIVLDIPLRREVFVSGRRRL